MMAEALAKGFVSKGAIQPSQVFCHDPSVARQEVFKAMGAFPCASGSEVSSFSSRSRPSAALASRPLRALPCCVLAAQAATLLLRQLTRCLMHCIVCGCVCTLGPGVTWLLWHALRCRRGAARALRATASNRARKPDCEVGGYSLGVV